MLLSHEEKPWNKSTENCESIPSDYACPIKDCSSHPNEKIIHWIHKNCGGSFRLYENGKEKCQKCGREDYFCKWSYSCSKDLKSEVMSYATIKNIMQKIVGMNSTGIPISVLMNICFSIENQYKQHPECFINDYNDNY